MTQPPIIRLENVSKLFGPITAVKDVNLSVFANEILAFVGDNGAGKSTLAKLIVGFYHPTSGKIYVDNKEVFISNPQVAQELGIEMIYQDLGLVEEFDVVSNVFLGKELYRRFLPGISLLDHRTMIKRTKHLLEKLRIYVQPSQVVYQLSGGQRQSVAIARAMHSKWPLRLMIMDEPTAALGVEETEKVKSLVKDLKNQGITVIIISHNLEDVFSLSDRIIVLRKGEVVGNLLTPETDQAEVVSLITGAKLAQIQQGTKRFEVPKYTELEDDNG